MNFDSDYSFFITYNLISFLTFYDESWQGHLLEINDWDTDINLILFHIRFCLTLIKTRLKIEKQ